MTSTARSRTYASRRPSDDWVEASASQTTGPASGSSSRLAYSSSTCAVASTAATPSPIRSRYSSRTSHAVSSENSPGPHAPTCPACRNRGPQGGPTCGRSGDALVLEEADVVDVCVGLGAALLRELLQPATVVASHKPCSRRGIVR